MFLFNVYCLVASANRWIKKGVKLGSSCQKKIFKDWIHRFSMKTKDQDKWDLILNHTTICQKWLGIQSFQKLHTLKTKRIKAFFK